MKKLLFIFLFLLIAAQAKADLNLTAGEGVDIVKNATASTVTVSGEDASDTNKGIASFSAEFGVSSGAVTIGSSITRDTEWDTAAEINAATTDADFLTAEVDGSTTNEIEVVDETFNATNFNGGTASAVSQDDFYDLWHGIDTDDDGDIDAMDATVWATKQAADADLTDLADGSLTASKVAGVADADYGEVVVSSGAWALENDALDDQYYDSEADLTGLLDNNYQPLEATLTDIADGTIAENLVNTANPWADNEVSDTLTASVVSDADKGDVTISSGVWSVENDSHDHAAASSTVTINATDIVDLNAGTAITADLEEEAHAAEHAVSAADTVFPADPGSDQFLMWDDDPGALVWSAPAGAGDITAVGDCADGACFAGASGTTLTFNNAGGDATVDYDGTDFSINKPIEVTGLVTTSVGIDGVGAVDLDYGSADITDHSFTTNDCTFIIDGGATISTGDHLTLGTTQWDNGSDLIDGEQIAADTIDDDSIDFSDVTGADLTLTDCGAVTTSGANDITAGGDVIATGSDLSLGTAGVKLTGDGDGALTILGLGDGSDENLVINFDDTSNEVDITTGTGVLDVDFNTIDLNTDTLDLTGTGTINGLDAIDATGEATLEAALDIAGEVTSTGMGSTVIADSVAVTSWALTTPTITTSVAINADAADAGAIRLSNADYIYSEAAPAGTDISVLGVDSSEVVQIAASGASGVTITPAVTITGDLIVNGDDIQLGATGVKITDDTDGAITFLGTSAGSDEDLTINLDDTANTIVLSSSTGVTTIDNPFNIQMGEKGIILDAAISGDGYYSGITESGTAGATLAFGDLVYLNNDDSRWELADANLSDGYDKKLGICVLAAAGDASATTILLYGKVNAATEFPSLTVGAPAYISETAGDIVVAAPTTTDAATRVVGFANTADELYFCPSKDYYTHT